jgi:23S rRNA (guanosine2251-2'-O)-methyltransferase
MRNERSSPSGRSRDHHNARDRNTNSRGRNSQKRDLRNRSTSKGLGGDQIEGRRAVRELLAGRRRVREVWISESTDESELLNEIIEQAEDRRVPLRYVSRPQLHNVTRGDAPQGVVAFASELVETDIEVLLETTETAPFLLVFDGVTDPHNLGALIRTGECAGITGVVLPRHRSAHITPIAAKASAGAIEHIPMALVAGVPAALAECKEAGVWTVGLDPDGDTDIHDLQVADQPVALVLGAEGAGLSRLTKQRCDVLASIPQYGAISSLNVAAAGAIACFEVARRRAGA